MNKSVRRSGWILTALTACLLSAAPSFADEASMGKDWFIGAGYKMWINTWNTVIPAFPSQGGTNYQSIVKSGIPAHVPNMSIRYKNLLLSGSYLTTGDFNFPTFTDMISVTGAGGASSLVKVDVRARREEYDVNLGYYVHRSILLTVGYKGVIQKYKSVYSRVSGAGVVFNGDPNSETHYNGVTAGVAGAAPIGKGFSVYGSGVGGFMNVTFKPSPSKASNDTGLYEAAELGFAWKAPSFPMSFNLGYKYQVIDTYTDDANYKSQRAEDVTRGYVLGLTFIF